MSPLVNDQITDLRVISIGALSQRGKWQTEAMRSYLSARLIWFTRGQGRITIAGVTRGYGPNNLIYIPADTMHGFEAGPQVHGHIVSLPRTTVGVWPDKTVHLRLQDVLIQGELGGLLENLQRELKSDKLAAKEAADYHAGLLSVFFARQHADRDELTRPETASARLVSAYTALIETDFETSQNVSDYAKKLGVTTTHLTRCCNQTCGRSALTLLNERILFEARLRLLQSNRAVKDIASELGYSSAAYFTRAFQAETGKTPSEFRKSR